MSKPVDERQPIRLAASDLVDWATGVFQAAGCDAAEARTIATSLTRSNLVGHDSHGIGMLPMYLRHIHVGEVQIGQSPQVVVDMGAMLTLDAGKGFGAVAGRYAMTIAIERAQLHGCAVVGTHNAHHLGRIGQWAEQCADAGLASLHFVNVLSPPRVAPWGGMDARLVTNPVCLGVPDGPTPIVLDYATSAIAIGKARVAYEKGEPVPKGALIDSAGRPTTDPRALFAEPIGALLPFAQHKGFAMAVMCELLGGMLSGGQVQCDAHHSGVINNMLSFLFRPEVFCTPERQREQIDALSAWLKGSPSVDPAAPVQMPGEPERVSAAKRQRDGIPLPAGTVQELVEAALSVGVDQHPFG